MTSYFPPPASWVKAHRGKRTDDGLIRRRENKSKIAFEEDGGGKKPSRGIKIQSTWLRWRGASSVRWRGVRPSHKLCGHDCQDSPRPSLPMYQQVFSCWELCSYCPHPSSSQNTSCKPLIFLQHAGSMPRTSCSLWVMVCEHRTSPEGSKGCRAPESWGKLCPRVHWLRGTQ